MVKPNFSENGAIIAVKTNDSIRGPIRLAANAHIFVADPIGKKSVTYCGPSETEICMFSFLDANHWLLNRRPRSRCHKGVL
jgi:hypothetical protein